MAMSSSVARLHGALFHFSLALCIENSIQIWFRFKFFQILFKLGIWVKWIQAFEFK
jgi:hypothetical protein